MDGATRNAGRVAGLLASEIASERMTLAIALETLLLSDQWQLNSTEIDYVRGRLIAELTD
jgi:hypothetical protein